MTEKSASDVLRELLDERGVEYETDDRNGLRETTWCGTAAFQLSPTAKMTMIVTPDQAIAATLGDEDYERKMDALLCRLTNGKFSKSRAYGLDFMESCVNEEFEMLYADELNAELGGGECELTYGETDEGVDSWFTQCGGRFNATFEDRHMVHPKFCQLCGRKAVER